MKKVIFALAAVVALAACSKEETVSFDKGAAIGFDTFVDNATRVDDPSLTNTNLADFAVYGAVTKEDTALIFDNVKVAKNGDGMAAGDYAGQESTDWKYAGTQYWIAGATYNFAAVAPYSCGKIGAFDAGTKKTTISFTNDGVTDLLYAQSGVITGQEGAAAGAAQSNNQAVAFTFRHVLSKVKFSFENQYLSTGTTIRVRDIELTNAHQTASVTLDATTTAWTGHTGVLPIAFGNAADSAVDAEEAIAQNNELESFNVRFIIPGDEHEYIVSFSVDVLYGTTVVETYNHTASLTFKPAAGNAYDIKTVINHTNIDPEHAQEPIEFTATVADWNYDVNGDHVVDSNDDIAM